MTRRPGHADSHGGADPTLETRVTELEIRLAHLSRLVDQLNEVVTQQTLAADRQQRTIARLTEQIQELRQKPLPPIDPLEDRPPHY